MEDRSTIEAAIRSLVGIGGGDWLTAGEIVEKRPDLAKVFFSRTSHGVVVKLGRALAERASQASAYGYRISHRKDAGRDRMIYRIVSAEAYGETDSVKKPVDSCYNCGAARANPSLGGVFCHARPPDTSLDGWPSVDHLRDRGHALICTRYAPGQDLSAFALPPSDPWQQPVVPEVNEDYVPE
jgi:hypothetical protein